jgi:hypothetical protein
MACLSAKRIGRFRYFYILKSVRKGTQVVPRILRVPRPRPRPGAAQAGPAVLAVRREAPEGEEVMMLAVRPSQAFNRFAAEIPSLQPSRPDFFEAKQRMLERVEGIAICEAITIHWLRLLLPLSVKEFTIGLENAERILATAPDRSLERHHAEVLLNLYARTLNQISQRRLLVASVTAAVLAVITSVVGIAAPIISSHCWRA